MTAKERKVEEEINKLDRKIKKQVRKEITLTILFLTVVGGLILKVL